MDLELKGRAALVTGASAGIGRGIARVLAAEGVQLAITARREDLLHSLAEEITSAGGLAPLVIPVDLAAPEAPDLLRDRVLGAFGYLDILINNAGNSWHVHMDTPDEEWDKAYALCFRAVRQLTRAFLPSMQERRWGRIINVTGTFQPTALHAGVAAKAGLHVWAKGMAWELGGSGITINMVAPGRIISEQVLKTLHPTPEDRRRFAEANIPLGYLGEPADVGYMVAFLASTKASYLTGEVFHVDGGMHRSPF